MSSFELSTKQVCIAAAVVAFGVFVSWASKIGRRESYLPPGPPTLPLLGNLHQLPLEYAHRQMTKWAGQYGPIFSLKASNQTIVVVTGAADAKAICDKASAISSDRPPLHVANEIITNGYHLLAMPYGPRWRLVRKVIHQHLTIRMCEEHHQKVQQAESTQMIYDILQKPEDYYNRARRYSTAVILSIVFGRRGPTWDGAVKDIYNVMDPWSEIVETGATPPVDVFPFLKTLPDFVSGWRKKAQNVRNMELKLYGGLADEVRKRRAGGVDRGSLLDKVFDAQESGNDALLDDEQVAYIGGVLLEGGSDTTSSLLLAFMLACCAFPRVMKKAQEEVDRVVGRGRMPNFSDFDDLPYIRQCVKEVQRWRPVVIMSFPHFLTQDLTHGSYLLPKGTTIITNVWGMHHDEKRFPNSQEFIPERYADFPLSAPEYAAMGADQERDHYGYGFGRRICVGLHIAERSMFLNIARLMWAFDITEDPSAPVDIDAFTAGFLSAPKPFKCRITPRDAGVSAVLDKEMLDAKTVFAQYED